MDNVDPIPEKFVLELWSVRTRRGPGNRTHLGKLNTIHVATSDDNLIPLYVLTQAYGTVMLDLGGCGEVVVVVLPHACFWAFLVLPCARIHLLIGWYAGYSSVV